MSVDDKYTYPGSGGVLVNHLGIRDAALLDRALNDHASIEWAQLRREPLPKRFDVAELQRIHLRLLHAVYPFAGQLRDVDAQATGTAIPYSRPEFIPAQARTIDEALRRNDYLRGMPRDQIVDRLAYHWGELTTGGSALSGGELSGVQGDVGWVQATTGEAGRTQLPRQIPIEESDGLPR